MILHRGKIYKNVSELVTALEAENKDLSGKLQIAIDGLEFIEYNCPCGARPVVSHNHPHLVECKVGETLLKIRQKSRQSNP